MLDASINRTVDSFNTADRSSLLAILTQGDRFNWRYDLSKRAGSLGKYDKRGEWIKANQQPQYLDQMMAIRVSLADSAALAFIDTAVLNVALCGSESEKKIALTIIRTELARAKRIVRREVYAARSTLNPA